GLNAAVIGAQPSSLADGELSRRCAHCKRGRLRSNRRCALPTHSKIKPMIFRGPYPDVTIPEVSLTDFIFGSFAEIKDKPALIDGPTGRMLTYKQFAGAVKRTA